MASSGLQPRREPTLSSLVSSPAPCYGRLCTAFKAPQSPGNRVPCEQRRSFLQWIDVPCPLEVPPQFPSWPSAPHERGAARAVKAPWCQLAGLPTPAHPIGCSQAQLTLAALPASLSLGSNLCAASPSHCWFSLNFQ